MEEPIERESARIPTFTPKLDDTIPNADYRSSLNKLVDKMLTGNIIGHIQFVKLIRDEHGLSLTACKALADAWVYEHARSSYECRVIDFWAGAAYVAKKCLLTTCQKQDLTEPKIPCYWGVSSSNIVP